MHQLSKIFLDFNHFLCLDKGVMPNEKFLGAICEKFLLEIKSLQDKQIPLDMIEYHLNFYYEKSRGTVSYRQSDFDVIATGVIKHLKNSSIIFGVYQEKLMHIVERDTLQENIADAAQKTTVHKI